MKWIVFLSTLGLYWLVYSGPSPHDEHIRLAYSMLHGRLDVNAYPVWEQVIVQGKAYILHPPLGAIACLPFVALGFYNQTLISMFYGAVAVTLAYVAMKSSFLHPVVISDGLLAGGKDGDALGVPSIVRDEPQWTVESYEESATSGHTYTQQHQPKHRIEQHAIWLTLFFALGTVFSYEATLGASWGFCLTLSTIPTFLALIELQGERRPLLVGINAALAALARYELALIWPVYLLLLLRKPPHRGSSSPIQMVTSFLIPLQLAVIGYFAFNLARFGTVTDPSLWMWYAQDAAGGKLYPWGPFSIHYLPLGIFTAIFAGPHFQMTWPWLRPTAFGQSLLLTSPAILLALRVDTRREHIFLACTLALAMCPAISVWSNGVEQFGARYWIQALPFLLALMARTPLDRFAKTLILASILFCCWGTYSIRIYGWG